MAIDRDELVGFINDYLDVSLYSDYGPNGLQIEGRPQVRKVAFAVSATRDSIEKAVAAKVDALIVHHGLFWKFHGVRTISGAFARRVKPLVQNDINLLGYHLPLDGHQEIGNARAVADLLNLSSLAPFGIYKGSPTGIKGKFSAPISVLDLKEKISTKLGHDVLIACANPTMKVSSMGIITGGADNEWVMAEEQGLDSYLTGEMSEHHWNEARESDLCYFAAGHHATEQFGIQRLQELIASRFSVESLYIDSENPA